MTNVREWPKSQLMWGYYNLGRLWGVAYTRREAIFEIERITDVPWAEARKSCEVHKVRVEKYAP